MKYKIFLVKKYAVLNKSDLGLNFDVLFNRKYDQVHLFKIMFH